MKRLKADAPHWNLRLLGPRPGGQSQNYVPQPTFRLRPFGSDAPHRIASEERFAGNRVDGRPIALRSYIQIAASTTILRLNPKKPYEKKTSCNMRCDVTRRLHRGHCGSRRPDSRTSNGSRGAHCQFHGDAMGRNRGRSEAAGPG